MKRKFNWTYAIFWSIFMPAYIALLIWGFYAIFN